MATAAQITANQANAQHSTGPRTAEGKANSARNHTAHGLSSREFVILPHQEAEFEAFMTGLNEDIQPHGPLEHDLFTQFAHAAWNLRRCRQAERELQLSHTHGADPILDAQVADRLRIIDLYLRRSERAYHRTLKELKSLQTNRRYVNDIELIAFDRTADAHPAPLAQHLSLEPTRRRAVEAADQSRSQRFIAQTYAELEAEKRMLDDSTRQHAPERSNPIPAAPKAATAR